MHISSWVDVPDDRRRRIDELSHAELLHYFSLDGAMLVDIEDFRLRGVSTYFRGHGGRKNIAASITHDHRDVLALVVSQDGGTYLMHHDSRGDEYERDDFERFEVGHPRVPTSFR